MKKIFSFFVLIVMTFACVPFGMRENVVFAADEIELVGSKSALLLDCSTGTILYSYEGEKRLPIASMTKIMTLNLIFDSIESGDLIVDEKIMISQNAADTKGSQAFLDAGECYRVDELVKSIVVASANDSCVALAEKIAGNEKLFASKMNEKCAELGLKNTHFSNSTGLPDVDHFSCAKDVAVMMMSICENPMFLKYSKIWMDEIVHVKNRKTELVNTNRMIKTYQGCIGGKTGFTNEAGYCIATVAERNGMKLISVVAGGVDSKTRFVHATELLDFGFANFESKTLVQANVAIDNFLVKHSKQTVAVCPKQSFSVVSRKGEDYNYETNIVSDKLVSPVKEGDVVGKIEILKNNEIVFETNLIAMNDCKTESFGKIFKNVIDKW